MSLNPTKFINTSQEEIKSDPSLPSLSDQGLIDLDSLDELEKDASLPEGQSNSSTITAVFKLLPLGLSSLTLLYLFNLGGQIDSIRKGHNQVLVQTVGGRSIVAEPVDNYVRTPATIEKTVKLWTDLTFNWVQKLPSGEKDPGIKIGEKTFPTRLISGSTLMTQDLQQVWYQVFQKREDYLPRNFLGSNATRIFFPKLQTTPRLATDSKTGRDVKDRYEVEIHGDWIEYSPETPQLTSCINVNGELLILCERSFLPHPPASTTQGSCSIMAYKSLINKAL